MASLVQGMLEGYRYYLHGRELPYRWATHDVADVAREIVRMAGQTPYGHGRDISYEGEEECPWKTDEDKLKQVLLNLVKNACQATRPETGTVTVGLRRHADGIILRIQDNGSGMDGETLERIWDPFFSTRGHAGLGLGLDICRTFVEGLGGTIECRSTPGAGTLFLVQFPSS
jgi:signal transduction histidine kinase